MISRAAMQGAHSRNNLCPARLRFKAMGLDFVRDVGEGLLNTPEAILTRGNSMTAARHPLRAIGAVASVALWAGAAAAQTAVSPAPLPPDMPEPAPAKPALATGAGILDIDAVDPDLVLTLRAGVQVSPAYLGSDDYEFGPDVAARLDYIRFPNGFDFGSGRTVGFRTGWGLRGSARYLGERDADEHDVIEGLDDVDWSFELGLGVGYEQRNWRAFTDVRYGVIGHNAWVGEVGADSIAYPVDGLTVTLPAATRNMMVDKG